MATALFLLVRPVHCLEEVVLVSGAGGGCSYAHTYPTSPWPGRSGSGRRAGGGYSSIPTCPASPWSGRSGSGRWAGGGCSYLITIRLVHGLEEVVLVGRLVVATALFLPVRPVHGLEEIGGLVVAAALFLPV